MNRCACLIACIAGFAFAAPPATTREQRGEGLVRYGGCNDCHTPMKLNPQLGMPLPDMSRMLSGHPQGEPDPVSELRTPDVAVIGPTFTSFKMPFGIVYAPNLTPDKETGLGEWTEKMFIDAMRTGKHMGGQGRVILLPMPWPAVGSLSDDDLKALFAYLRSIPPIRNEVPPPKVPDAAIAKMTEAANKAAAPRPKSPAQGGSGPPPEK